MTLLDFIKRVPYDTGTALKICRDIAHLIDWLHSEEDTALGNLNLSNVFINDRAVIKMEVISSSVLLQIRDDDSIDSLHFFAPEVISVRDRTVKSKKADVYSFGIVKFFFYFIFILFLFYFHFFFLYFLVGLAFVYKI